MFIFHVVEMEIGLDSSSVSLYPQCPHSFLFLKTLIMHFQWMQRYACCMMAIPVMCVYKKQHDPSLPLHTLVLPRTCMHEYTNVDTHSLSSIKTEKSLQRLPKLRCLEDAARVWTNDVFIPTWCRLWEMMFFILTWADSEKQAKISRKMEAFWSCAIKPGVCSLTLKTLMN